MFLSWYGAGEPLGWCGNSSTGEECIASPGLSHPFLPRLHAGLLPAMQTQEGTTCLGYREDTKTGVYNLKKRKTKWGGFVKEEPLYLMSFSSFYQDLLFIIVFSN